MMETWLEIDRDLVYQPFFISACTRTASQGSASRPRWLWSGHGRILLVTNHGHVEWSTIYHLALLDARVSDSFPFCNRHLPDGDIIS